MLRFSDGVTFDTSGELRIERRHDGLYVVGENMMWAVDSYAEGSQEIKDFYDRREKRQQEGKSNG